MKKTVVIHQPDFIPYLGFFHRFLYADEYIILDNVQFIKKSSKTWQHRDKIKTSNGESWLSLSVKSAPLETKLKDIMLIQDQSWKKKHLNVLTYNYKNSNYFYEIFPFIEELYSINVEKMVEFNLNAINILCRLFNIKIPQIRASSLDVSGKANELVVNILKVVKATHYLSGIGAKDYFEKDIFERAGIEILWQNFKHPVYPQLYGEFIPYLSSIDLLFNCGIEKSREILRSA